MPSQGVDVEQALPGFVKTTKEGGIILFPEMSFASAQDLATLLPLPSHFISLIYSNAFGTGSLPCVFFISSFFLLSFVLSFRLSLLLSFFFFSQESQTQSFIWHMCVTAVVDIVSKYLWSESKVKQHVLRLWIKGCITVQHAHLARHWTMGAFKTWHV